MNRKRWTDRGTDALAKAIAVVARPVYDQYGNYKRARRLNKHYSGARSRRWDITYQSKRFWSVYKLPVTAVGIVATLAIGITWAATGMNQNASAPGSVEAVINTEKPVVAQTAAAETAAVSSSHTAQPTMAVDVTAQGETVETSKPLSQEETLEQQIRAGVWDAMNVGVLGYDLKINDMSAGFFRDRDSAEGMLDDLVGLHMPEEEGVEVLRHYFKQDVDVEKTYHRAVDLLQVKAPEAILDYIVRGTNEQKRHIVEKGENFWVIAKRYELDVADLLKANPEVIPERLQIGQEISLIVPRPLISVYTVEYAEYNDDIAYEIVYEDNGSMYKGEYKTKKSGEKGQQFVRAEIYKEDGREVGRKILNSDVLAEPVTKVVYRGTKNPPPRKGTGTFAKPTSRGYITSGFGWRWGRRHNGIDIGVAIGTDVKAADGGVVVYAGTKGGYGKCVIIDHGANMKSLYAHNSKLYVSVGSKVFKGQTIAASGNTGRSTGPHLHFEIQKNGVPVNPTKYVRY